MDLEFRAKPFEHAVIAQALPYKVASLALSHLEKARWTICSGTGYCFERAEADTVLALLSRSGVIDLLEATVRRFWRIDKGTAALALQKYGPDSRIGPHSDNGVSEARVVINLNRGWTFSRGGFWILADNRAVSPPRRCLAGLHNTGFMFCPAEATFHALTRADEASVSYALVVGFGRPG